MVAASHVLVAYAGAMRANVAVKRTKEEAKKRAEGIAVRARKGADFAKLADENSDDPSAKLNHGSLGKFTRTQMVKPFADAAFGMKPGDVSNVVETPFGFHVIKRTE
jgi:peptidyl-prolyl cis-trans isomerase D